MGSLSPRTGSELPKISCLSSFLIFAHNLLLTSLKATNLDEMQVKAKTDSEVALC